MPLMYECADALKIRSHVSQFCIPIGVTLNKDGSALFIATSTIFMAQLEGLELNAGQITMVW